MQRLMVALSALTAVQMRGEGCPPESPWHLTGSARVRVTDLPSGLLLQEEGRLDRDGLSLAYQASWSVETDEEGQLWLGHARQGSTKRLLILLPESDTEWGAAQPHLCGADLYEARITLLPDNALRLRWQTRGPKKNHIITRHFTASPALT